jgi:Ni/Co efflux regulator RcnB
MIQNIVASDLPLQMASSSENDFQTETKKRREFIAMKKLVIAIVIMALFAGSIVFVAPQSVYGQSYYLKKVTVNGRTRWVRVRKPSFYRRHRNRMNMAIGTGAGAAIGGLIGGGKGAAIGAGTGLGASALYTYKLKKKKRHYRKVRRY